MLPVVGGARAAPGMRRAPALAHDGADSRMDELGQLRNRWVCFKLRDVFVPPAHELLERLHAEDLLQGRVVGITEKGGAGQETYLVVEVLGIESAVVVPLPRVLSVV